MSVGRGDDGDDGGVKPRNDVELTEDEERDRLARFFDVLRNNGITCKMRNKRG